MEKGRSAPEQQVAGSNPARRTISFVDFRSHRVSRQSVVHMYDNSRVSFFRPAPIDPQAEIFSQTGPAPVRQAHERSDTNHSGTHSMIRKENGGRS